jgi:hypothetical protein
MDYRKLRQTCYRSAGPLFASASQSMEVAQIEQPANHGLRLADILTALSLLMAVATIATLILTFTADPAPVSGPVPNEWYP